MGRRALIAVASLGLAVLAIAGCGGGGDDESTPTAAHRPEPTGLTKSELIAQGDGVCAEVNAAVGALAGAETQAAGAATQVADLYDGMVESLKRLGKPREAAGYSEFIGAAEELSGAEDQAKLAAERGDTAALASAESSAEGALAQFRSAASDYGFRDCSEGPSELPSGGAGGASTAPAGEGAGGVEAEAAAPEEEPAPEAVEETAPEAGGVEEAPETGGESAGGGAATPEAAGGGGTGSSSGGIGPG